MSDFFIVFWFWLHLILIWFIEGNLLLFLNKNQIFLKIYKLGFVACAATILHDKSECRFTTSFGSTGNLKCSSKWLLNPQKSSTFGLFPLQVRSKTSSRKS